jgi:hypothetical protein
VGLERFEWKNDALFQGYMDGMLPGILQPIPEFKASEQDTRHISISSSITLPARVDLDSFQAGEYFRYAQTGLMLHAKLKQDDIHAILEMFTLNSIPDMSRIQDTPVDTFVEAILDKRTKWYRDILSEARSKHDTLAAEFFGMKAVIDMVGRTVQTESFHVRNLAMKIFTADKYLMEKHQNLSKLTPTGFPETYLTSNLVPVRALARFKWSSVFDDNIQLETIKNEGYAAWFVVYMFHLFRKADRTGFDKPKLSRQPFFIRKLALWIEQAGDPSAEEVEISMGDIHDEIEKNFFDSITMKLISKPVFIREQEAKLSPNSCLFDLEGVQVCIASFNKDKMAGHQNQRRFRHPSAVAWTVDVQTSALIPNKSTFLLLKSFWAHRCQADEYIIPVKETYTHALGYELQTTSD